MESNNFTRPSVKTLLKAIELQEKKGRDYQNPNSRVRQADYYPHGVYSILDTVHGKILRMYSVLESMEAGASPNFESVQDSAIDAINYLSFIVAYIDGKIDGQDLSRDIFNKPIQDYSDSSRAPWIGSGSTEIFHMEDEIQSEK